jgi:hypothetical protein
MWVKPAWEQIFRILRGEIEKERSFQGRMENKRRNRTMGLLKFCSKNRIRPPGLSRWCIAFNNSGNWGCHSIIEPTM